MNYEGPATAWGGGTYYTERVGAATKEKNIRKETSRNGIDEFNHRRNNHSIHKNTGRIIK